jgi:hypothetical protein
MKFALVFITSMMGANVADAPRFNVDFTTVSQCEAARRPLVKPSELKGRDTGWQCVPIIGNGGN